MSLALKDMTYKTFTDAVDTFLEASKDTLTELDAPAVVALQQAAAELDAEGVTAALLNTFGVTYRHLRDSRGTQEEVSEAEHFLNDL